MSNTINATQSNHNSFENLDRLRQKTVKMIAIFSLFAILLMTIIRLIEANYLLVGIDLVCISILALSYYWAREGKLNLALLSSCITLIAMTFIITFWREAIFVIPITTLITSIYIIILKSKFHKIAIVMLSLFVLGFVSVKLNYQTSQIIIFFIQLLCFFAVFNLFTSFLSQQDRRLQSVIHHQKSLNQEISQLNNNLTEKNNELETFNHIMSHDLKAPLTTIGSFTKLLRQSAEKNGTLKTEYFNYIEDSVKDMAVLIEDLLLFFKVEEGDNSFEKVSLNALIQSIQTIYQYDIIQNKLLFDVQQLPTIKGNPVLIKTLFSNLVSNATKYQPKNKEEHTPTVRIWANESQHSIEIFIADNGIGIKKENIANLFTPFKRFHSNNEYKGTGLGMSICKRVMDNHKGGIEVFKTSERGTTFKLIFPKT